MYINILYNSFRDNDTSNSTTDVNIGSKRRSSHPQADRMRCSNNNQNSTKKIRLCSASNVEIACNGVVKRRCDEWNEVMHHYNTCDLTKFLNMFHILFFFFRKIGLQTSQ